MLIQKSAPTFRSRYFPGFSPQDLKNLEKYYAAQLSRHRSPARRVGWRSSRSQRVRFENLIKVGPVRGTRIIDIGCGLGAFRGFLKEKKIPVEYTGVDLFPSMLAEAGALHPESRFEARVLAARPFPAGTFDYAFLSGVFNIKVRDNWRYMEAVLKNALKLVKKAVAFNVLNSESGLKEVNRFMVSPRELVSFGRKLGVPKTRLLDDYHHLDLTLFLYKRKS